MRNFLLSSTSSIFLIVSYFITSPPAAGNPIKDSLSWQVAKKFATQISPEAAEAIDTLADLEKSNAFVAKNWTYEALPENRLLAAPFMRKTDAIALYRHILAAEPQGMHSYHGHDHFTAGRYDIYTALGAELKNTMVEERSRFRYDPNYHPFCSAEEFLHKTTFINDHDPRFDRHGISAVPHLFSGTTDLGENCLSGLFAINCDMKNGPETLKSIVRSIGFKDEQKYIDLIQKHLHGGFLLRFTFTTPEALDLATYPSPNAAESTLYGRPWRTTTTKELIPSSVFHTTLNGLEGINNCNISKYIFDIQYRNIFIPKIYNDPSLVTTKTFSSEELPTLDEYYQILRGYIKEDMKDLSMEQREQAELWLK